MADFLTMEEELGQVVNELLGLTPSVGWPKKEQHRQCIIMPTADDVWLNFDDGTFCRPINSLVLILTHHGTELATAYKVFKEWVYILATKLHKCQFESGGFLPAITKIERPGRLDAVGNLVAIEVYLQPFETELN